MDFITISFLESYDSVSCWEKTIPTMGSSSYDLDTTMKETLSSLKILKKIKHRNKNVSFKVEKENGKIFFIKLWKKA